MKRSSILATTLVALGIQSCLVPSIAQSVTNDIEQTIDVGGQSRSYILHLPQSHPHPCALVIVFHGGGGRAVGMRAITSMNVVSNQNGFAVAYPQGLNGTWNSGGSDLGLRPPRDDVAFARALIKDIKRQVQIDEKQVFVCGFSNGGSLSALLTLVAPDLISAAAMVGSGYNPTQLKEHQNPKPIPVLFIEGTDDPCHPYKGGETTGPKMGGQFQGMHHGVVLSTDESEEFWRKIDGCTTEPLITQLPHKTKDGTTTTYKLWRGANGNDVAEYIVQGGGHCWPGGYQYFPESVIGKTTYDFSASEAIWRFFSQHQKR